MRIALFSWESLYAIKIGGVGVHVFNLARSLQRLGNEVHIFTRQGEKLTLQDMVEGVYIHRLPWNQGDNFFQEVKSFNNTLVYYYTEISSRAGKFDLLHCHDWLTFDAGLRLKDEVCLICTFHTTELGRSGHWPESGISREISLLEKSAIDSSRYIIAISYTLRRELELLYHLPDWKTEVIYHGIDTAPAKAAAKLPQTIRQQLSIDSAARIILFVGSFNHKKGTDLLLSTCKDIIEKDDNAAYVFFGSGEMQRRIEGMSSDFPGRVFICNSPEPLLLQQLYYQAYIIVAPFRSDPFAAITLTAWASGKPVISLKTGASAEIIYNNVNGIISSEEQLSNDILRLLQDPEKVKWLGNNARVTVNTAFVWDEIAKNTEKIYAKVLSAVSG